jgi:hypothetical protein
LRVRQNELRTLSKKVNVRTRRTQDVRQPPIHQATNSHDFHAAAMPAKRRLDEGAHHVCFEINVIPSKRVKFLFDCDYQLQRTMNLSGGDELFLRDGGFEALAYEPLGEHKAPHEA